jgi:hypothetical protein
MKPRTIVAIQAHLPRWSSQASERRKAVRIPPGRAVSVVVYIGGSPVDVKLFHMWEDAVFVQSIQGGM